MLYPIELRVHGHIVTQTYLCLGLRLHLPGETLTGMGRRANVSIPRVLSPLVGGFCKRFSRETSVLSTVPST